MVVVRAEADDVSAQAQEALTKAVDTVKVGVADLRDSPSTEIPTGASIDIADHLGDHRRCREAGHHRHPGRRGRCSGCDWCHHVRSGQDALLWRLF